MPSYTLTVSTENATRITNAIEDQFEREGGETERQMFDRWLKGQFTALVYKYDRRQASSAIAPDADIVEVT